MEWGGDVMSKINVMQKIESMKKINWNAYQKLKLRYEEVKDCKQLDILEAKKLCKLMLEADEDNKKQYRELLIFGTLHWVYNFVCDSGLTAVKSSYFDVDDLISISTEVWINMLDSGELLSDNINCFTNLFQRKFYERVIGQLVSQTGRGDYFKSESGYMEVCYEDFGKVFEKYLEFINNGQVVDEKSCYSCVVKCLDEFGISQKLSDGEIYQVYLVFYNITKILEIKDISRLSRTDLKYLKYFLCDAIMSDRSTGLIGKGDFTDDVDRDIILEQMRQFIFDTTLLTVSQKKVIAERFGFLDGFMKSKCEVAKKFGVSGAAIYCHEIHASRKLRRSREMVSMKAALK